MNVRRWVFLLIAVCAAVSGLAGHAADRERPLRPFQREDRPLRDEDNTRLSERRERIRALREEMQQLHQQRQNNAGRLMPQRESGEELRRERAEQLRPLPLPPSQETGGLRRMSPEERRALRRQLHEAGRDLYRP